MNTNEFMDRLLEEAALSGLTASEIWLTQGDSFSVRAMDGRIEDYRVSSLRGLGFRGVWQGRMGYCSTQAFDEEAIGQLIRGVKESAELTEAAEQDEIFPGEAAYPDYAPPENDLADVTSENKLAACLRLEKAVTEADPRVLRAQYPSVTTGHSSVTLRNSFGLSLHYEDSVWSAGAGAVMDRGGTKVDGWHGLAGHRFSQLEPDVIGKEAAKKAANMLDVQPVPSGPCRVVLHRDALRDLLSTFSGIFSARNAQNKLSLLGGKEGQAVAAPCVTLMDDPLLPGGWASCPFDAEGSASRAKAIIEGGVLKTLLHNRKSARIQGCETTGNACRAGYSSPVGVSPTNLYLKPGDLSPEELLRGVGEGIVITEVSGLHAGANPVSGDFSLLSKGYTLRHGLREHGAEQMTLAGNFYELLKSIRQVANDLDFDGSPIGACTVDAGTLVISSQ